MKKYILALLLICSISCKNHENIKIGTYYDFQPSLAEMLMLYIFQGVIGYHCSVLSLTIYPDSSFAYVYNGVYYTGNWKCTKSSLSLYINKGIFTDFIGNDSINQILKSRRMTKQPYFNAFSPIIFDITSNHLQKTTGKGRHKILEKLTFNMP
jgi:hypothetical protein